MKRVTTGLAVAALAATSVLAGATTASAAPKTMPVKAKIAGEDYNPPPIQWGACTNASLAAAGAQCGNLIVPLNYNLPNGTKIKIAVSRVLHKTAKSQGIMLVNPGGPGGSGLQYSRLGPAVPKHAGDAYDWIGFDPRGVGSSQPSLACDGNYFPTNRPDYVPFTKTLESFWLKKTANYARACRANQAQLLRHVKTTDSATDMDMIRKALRQNKINYYGFSYGTYLGSVYATMFPTHVRRMVFDGVVDPRDVWYEANLNQDVAFEKTLGIFFRWIADNDDVYHLGTTQAKVKNRWYRMLDKSRQAAFDGQIGPDEWTDSFLSAGYYVYDWAVIADAFKQAVAGDYGPVEDLYAGANGSGPGSDNGYAMYLATQCTDVQWPTQWSTWKKDNWATYAKAPFETWSNAWFNAPCLNWGAPAAAAAPTVDGSAAPKILLIDETYDAATPFPGSIEIRKRFPKSILIEGVNGSTHSGSLSGIDCTDNRIADYLLSGKLDRRLPGNQSDVKCDPVPPPPAESSTARMAAPNGMPADLRREIVRLGTR